VTALAAADATESPALFTACNLTVYEVPFVNPEITTGLVVIGVANAV
jgi:hypothetical protein